MASNFVRESKPILDFVKQLKNFTLPRSAFLGFLIFTMLEFPQEGDYGPPQTLVGNWGIAHLIARCEGLAVGQESIQRSFAPDTVAVGEGG